jgi:hypothetical protein
VIQLAAGSTPGNHSAALAGIGGAASVGKPRWRRILSMTLESVIVAIKRSRPPHSGQARTSNRLPIADCGFRIADSLTWFGPSPCGRS